MIHRTHTRRWIRVLVCMLIGLALNITVAWGLAVWCQATARFLQWSGTVLSSPLGKSFERLTPEAWPRPVPQGWSEKPMLETRTRGIGWRCSSYEGFIPVGDWRVPGSTIVSVLLVDVLTGWPMPAWRNTRVFSDATGPVTLDDPGTLSTPPLDKWLGVGSFLPVIPLWPGALINTLVYAAAVWCVWTGVPWVRAKRRGRRGACLSCGYDLRGRAAGAPCPECGSASS